jgi:nucleoid DNA-binding protein
MLKDCFRYNRLRQNGEKPMSNTSSDADLSKPAVSSTTVADWDVKSAKPAGSEKPAARKSPSAGVSLVEMIVQEVTGSLERGDTVRLSSFGSMEIGQSINPETGNPIKSSPDRVMVFKPWKHAGFGHFIFPEFFEESNAPLPPEIENYDVVQSNGALAHVVVVPKDDPLGSTVSRVVERVPEIARIRRQELTEKNIDALVELYLADDPIAEARRAIETDNARERARFLSEVACLTSKEVAQNAGHQAANASVTASRWKQQGRIFSVPSRGSELYPAFQFREGQPHPAVAKILRELPKPISPWQTAFWFTSSNSWLRGATPADRLDDEAAVVKAAHRESEPIVG